MNEVELKVSNISTTIHPVNAYVLVLEEVNGHRKLPVIIGQIEALAVKAMMVPARTSRPLTHDLFQALTTMLGATLEKVQIYKVKDGVYFSYLFFEKDGKRYQIDSRTSDAVALAMRYRCPIYTLEAILENEHLRDMGAGAFSVPVNTISLPMLKEALKLAIEKENYEHASQLRDEIKRREAEGHQE